MHHAPNFNPFAFFGTGYRLHWKTGFADKTLWDWLQLLIIPFALALIAILFNRAERKNEQRISIDSQQEAALQTYYDRMSELIIDKNLRSDPNILPVARARTATALKTLDPFRTASLLRFLSETGLLNVMIKDELLDINLNGVDLWKINLSQVRLPGAKLRGANIQWANLSDAYLGSVDMSGACLWGTNFRNMI